MKVTAAMVILCASLASAGVVKTPVFDNQVIPKEGADCALGVVTPQGCAYVFLLLPSFWISKVFCLGLFLRLGHQGRPGAFGHALAASATPRASEITAATTIVAFERRSCP
ncbi:hypothetical protein BD289DRAFT_483096 [Coniella lustricola]|uniref:Uncharacterized protein n=1 Tax=Coniella lustricola TaxID=2025994 RepID=A0A2T3A6J4_9PEZI|nr:hypothetical protein BD289DRAFT_483096 [Coniella lustricola]